MRLVFCFRGLENVSTYVTQIGKLVILGVIFSLLFAQLLRGFGCRFVSRRGLDCFSAYDQRWSTVFLFGVSVIEDDTYYLTTSNQVAW